MPRHPRTDIPSTGSHRQSGGQNILRGVMVPVMMSTAVRARPCTISQCQCMSGRPTCAAGFGRWIKPTDLNRHPSIPRRFVVQLTEKLSPAGIGDGTAVALCPQHTFNRQCLNRDHLVFVDQSTRQLMQEVLSSVANGSMGARLFQLGLRPISGAFLFVRQTALLSNQTLLAFGQMARVGTLLSGAEDSKVCQPEIDAHRTATAQRFDGGRNTASDVPTPVRFPNHRDRARFSRKDTRPHHGQRLSHLCQREHAIAVGETGFGELRRLSAVLSAELWVTGAFVKEALVSCLKMAQALLEWDARHFVQPHKLGLPLQCRQHGVCLGKAAALLAILPRRFSQCTGTVIDKTHTAERSIQQVRLLRRGIETKTVGTFDRIQRTPIPGVATMFKFCSTAKHPYFLCRRPAAPSIRRA